MGIIGDSVDSVLNIVSLSTNLTTVLSSLSGGATETIALAQSLNITEFGHNNLNELNSIATGGITTFEGKTNKAVTGVTVDSNDAEWLDTKHFSGNANLSSGANNIAIVATDAQPANKTENQVVHATGPASTTPTFDANGNMTFDGTNTYVWDAENRLIRIEYPGVGNSSDFSFDAMGRNTKIVETVSNVPLDTKLFTWCSNDRTEERDEFGMLRKQFYFHGFTSTSNSYFYCTDHLSSKTEVIDASGIVEFRSVFDPSGQRKILIENVGVDFQYGGYYFHEKGSLCLTRTRCYKSIFGRWLSRDTIEEKGGLNLYTYVGNSPINVTDPLGLDAPYQPWRDPVFPMIPMPIIPNIPINPLIPLIPLIPFLMPPLAKPPVKPPVKPPHREPIKRPKKSPPGNPPHERPSPPRKRPCEKEPGKECLPPEPGSNPEVTNWWECSDWCWKNCPLKLPECLKGCFPYPGGDN